MNDTQLYINTTKGSPMKNSPSKHSTLFRPVNNPESSEKKRISYINTPVKRSRSRSSHGGGSSRGSSKNADSEDEAEEP